MNDYSHSIDFILEPEDNDRLANLCGQCDEYLHEIESRLDVKINHRGHSFRVLGDDGPVHVAGKVLADLYQATLEDAVSLDKVNLFLQSASLASEGQSDDSAPNDFIVNAGRLKVKGRGPHQRQYIQSITQTDLSFGVGPAGTGKTFLAVACAVEALESDQVRRIVLVRPAVEAGERLGFLPGDLAQKIDPYLRPLYDALYEMIGFEKVARLIERNVIEVAPLAYMRGRTLNESFVIMDEAQNSTIEQMKMFLTRMGFGSTMVVTGDITQIDLPRGQRSGLREAIDILQDVEGIDFTFFSSKDVVRHPLVQRIVDAYDKLGTGRQE